MLTERGLVDTANGYVHYRATGVGDPVVLIHKAARSSTMFAETMARLRSDYRLYAIDLPSCGFSDPVVGPITMDVLAGGVQVVLEHLDITGAVLLGASLGAHVTLEVARRVPGRVSGLVLESCPSYRPGEDPGAFHRIARLGYETDRYGYPLLRTSEHILAHDRLHAPKKIDQEWLQAENRDLICAGPRFWDVMPVIASFDVLGVASEITQPTLLLYGEDFHYSNRLEAIAEQLRDSRVVAIAGSGLFPEIDNPEAYEATLRHFLDEVKQKEKQQ